MMFEIVLAVFCVSWFLMWCVAIYDIAKTDSGFRREFGDANRFVVFVWVAFAGAIIAGIAPVLVALSLATSAFRFLTARPSPASDDYSNSVGTHQIRTEGPHDRHV